MLFTSPVSAVEEGEAIIRDAMEQAENPHHLGVTGTAGARPYQACNADVTVGALYSSKSLLNCVSLLYMCVLRHDIDLCCLFRVFTEPR